MSTIRLRTKFTAVISCLIIATSFLLSYYFIKNSTQEILRRQKERADTLARWIALNSEYGVLINNNAPLQSLVAGVMKEKDVIAVEVKDKNGMALVSVGEIKDPYYRASAPIITQKASQFKTAETGAEEQLLFFETPAGDAKEEIGLATIGVSLVGTYQRMSQMRSRAIQITFLVVAAAVIMIFFFVGKIIAPLKSLVWATEQLAQGDLDVTAKAVTTDEIGELAVSFNKMTQELKKSRSELEDYSRTLEDKVQIRTKDLKSAMDELKKAQAQIVRTEKLVAIGQLASSVGHELRNPLGAIGNALYYFRNALKESGLATKDPTISEFLDLADQEIKNSLNIISELLDFSKAIHLTPQPTDINELIRNMKAVIVVPSSVTWNESLSPDLPKVSIDPQKIRQVFINLANNAIQAMPNGGTLSVTTRTGVCPVDSTMCHIVEFKDTGAGISEENLKKVFEPFFTTKAKGTGLGLAICLGIVEKHGGKILVESEVGKGSTFMVKIPVSTPAVQAA